MRKAIKTIKGRKPSKKKSKSKSKPFNVKKAIIILGIIAVIVLLPEIIYSIISSLKSPEVNKEQKEWLDNYEKTIWYIKQHEGYQGTQYFCPAGQPTIGYGHVIKSDDRFPAKLNKRQADSLLRADLDFALDYLDQNLPFLKGLKKLAIAHFIFNCGIGTFSKSRLPYLIKNNMPIDNEILNFCYFTQDNKLVRSPYAYKLRKWELDLYKKVQSKDE